MSTPENGQPPGPDPLCAPTRRGLLDWLLGVSILGWAGSVVYPVVRYLTPLSRTGPSGPARLTSEQLTRLEADRFVIVALGRERVLVLRDEAGEVRALSATCTHEACVVRYVPEKRHIWCACHDGRFDLDGRVIAGPPPRPLPLFQAVQDQDGVLVSKQGPA